MAHPKKVILCVNASEQELSVLAFMLSTNGYRVLTATSAADAVEVFKANSVDLVIADSAMPPPAGIDARQLALQLRLISDARPVPIMLLGDLEVMGREIPVANVHIDKNNCPSVELLERIKIACARKRGPRKGVFYRKKQTAPAAQSVPREVPCLNA